MTLFYQRCSKKSNRPYTTAAVTGTQNKHEINIHRIVLPTGAPNTEAMMGPPRGDSKTGVKKAIPYTPYLLHTLTISLLLLVNTFLSFFWGTFSFKISLSFSPPYMIAIAEKVAPSVVTMQVSIKLSPDFSPMAGPSNIFAILPKNTAKYFNKSSIRLIFIELDTVSILR